MAFKNEQSTIVVPTDATTGKRIVIDGLTGHITAYDVNNNIVFDIEPGEWDMLNPYTGSRVRIVANNAAVFLTPPDNLVAPTETYNQGGLFAFIGNNAGGGWPGVISLSSPTVAAFPGGASGIALSGPTSSTDYTEIRLTADTVKANGFPVLSIMASAYTSNAALTSTGPLATLAAWTSSDPPVFKDNHCYRVTVTAQLYDTGAFGSLTHAEINVRKILGNNASTILVSLDMVSPGGAVGVAGTKVGYVKNVTGSDINAGDIGLFMFRVSGAGTSTLQAVFVDIQELGDINCDGIAALVAGATAL